MKIWSGTDVPLYSGVGEVSLLDVVVMLGRTSRFGGSGDREWTVLHHSFLVGLLWIKAGYPMAGLHHAMLHDAHEAYTGDIPAPVKAAIRARQKDPADNPLKKLEADLDARIRETLDLPAPNELESAQVKICDLAALVIESRLFSGPGTAHAVNTLDVAVWPESLRSQVLALVDRAVPELDLVASRRGSLGISPVGPLVPKSPLEVR